MEGHVARCLSSIVICRVFFLIFIECQSLPSVFSRIAECQNVYRVFFSKALGKLRVCRVSESLPSVFSLTLGKDMVCRVSDKIHSAKNMTLGKAFDFGSGVSDQVGCVYVFHFFLFFLSSISFSIFFYIVFYLYFYLFYLVLACAS